MKYQFLKGFFDGLRPIPIRNIADWADENRYLTSESAAEPGRWKTTRTPYLRDIMNDLSPNSPIMEVVAMKGVQLGFTESGLNAVGCFIDIAPCPIMYVMPTIEMSKAISESRVDPMIENSPNLRERVKPNRERDAGNTKFTKRFPGGILILSGANSAASLRSRPVKLLVLDEVDAYPASVDDEGSPVSLAEKRTSTFGFKKKIYKLSTPTLEGTSVIEKSYLATEQRKFHVPCPHCGVMQELIFSNLRWEKGKPETVRYYCNECDEPIEERFKTTMLENGEWVSTQPQNQTPLRRGYHINSLYSPIGWLSWADIAQQYEDAENDVNLMRVFVNTVLGETWKDQGEAPAWENLYNRRESYGLNKPPKEVAFLTAGVDVQKDRIEVEVVGWCKGKRSYSIDYRVLLGATSDRPVWDDLANILNETWHREDGAALPIRVMAVDSGYNTSEVYDFCRRFDGLRVIPTKGQEKQSIIVAPPRAVDTSRRGKKVGAIKVWHVGVSVIKSELYGWLRLEKGDGGIVPPGYCHFPQYDQHYFKGLTAEQFMISTDRRGYKKYEWVKKYERNEPLDCRVYARAAASVFGIDRMTEDHFNKISIGYGSTSKKVDKKRKPSSYW